MKFTQFYQYVARQFPCIPPENFGRLTGNFVGINGKPEKQTGNMTRCIIDALSNGDATRQSYDAFVAKSDPFAVRAAAEVLAELA